MTEKKKKQETENVAFQLRLNANIHSKLRETAENSGISMNKLINGLLEGCAAHLVEGEPYRNRDGFLCRRDEANCIFVGKYGEPLTSQEKKLCHDADMAPPAEDKGDVWFRLDYSVRGFVPGE